MPELARLAREPGLANPGLPDEEERPPLTGRDALQSSAQLGELAFASEEDRPTHWPSAS